MSDFYEGLRDGEILSLFKEFGKPVILTRALANLGWSQGKDRITGVIYWENTDGTRQTERPEEKAYSGYGVQSSYSHYQGNDMAIKVGDIRIYASGIEAPMVNDKFTVGGVTYNIISSKPVAPGDTDLMYDLQIRKG